MAYPKTHEIVVSKFKTSDHNIKIIDLGCATGIIVKALKEQGFMNVQYADIQDNFDGKVKIMDFNKPLKFASNSADVIICTEVINCISNHQLFFEEIRRILKPNGKFILTFPNVQSLFNKIYFLFFSKFIDMVLPDYGVFFIWQIPDYFKIQKKEFNRGFIPFIRIPFFKSRLFGQTYILECKVKK